MVDSATRRILITDSELLAASTLVEARFDDAVAEVMRIETARRFLAAAMAVEQALRIHTRCALVNHCGSHGNSNLREAAHGLFDALSDYVTVVRETADHALEHERKSSPAAALRPVQLEVA